MHKLTTKKQKKSLSKQEYSLSNVIKSTKKLSDWTNLSRVHLQLPKILSLKELRRNLKKITEEAEAIAVEVSGRQAIGILKTKIDHAKGFQSGGWFQSNDPYVIVFDATAKEIARTKIAPSTNSPGKRSALCIQFMDQTIRSP